MPKAVCVPLTTNDESSLPLRQQVIQPQNLILASAVSNHYQTSVPSVAGLVPQKAESKIETSLQQVYQAASEINSHGRNVNKTGLSSRRSQIVMQSQQRPWPTPYGTLKLGCSSWDEGATTLYTHIPQSLDKAAPEKGL